MQKKGTVTGINKTGSQPIASDEDLAKRAARIGLKENNTEGDIIHEMIHRLGFGHQQQNPFAGKFYSALEASNEQCLSKSREYQHVYWISYYDPASIMHYQLSSCSGMRLDCKVVPTRAAGRSKLESCEIDELIRERSPCFYAPSGVKGDKCFQRPAELLGGERYSDNDFGQAQCMSMLDQAWVLSRYFPVKQDTYAVEELVKKGICEAE